MPRQFLPLLLLLLAACAPQTLACSCLRRTFIQTYDATATHVVVRARVLQIRRETPAPSTRFPPSFPRRVVTFRALDVFKGCAPGDVFVVRTPANSAACGVAFRLAEVYLLNLDDAQSRDGGPVFEADACQFHRVWDLVDGRQRAFLRQSRLLSVNRCALEMAGQ